MYVRLFSATVFSPVHSQPVRVYWGMKYMGNLVARSIARIYVGGVIAKCRSFWFATERLTL